MSHFTVLVVGNDPEGQLEPFSEDLMLDEYSYPVNQRMMDDFTNFYYKKFPEDATLNFDALYEKYGADWNGMVWKIDKDTNTWIELSTYNHNSKWDWYQIGGRWSGSFKLKEGKTGKLGEKSWGMADTIEEGWVDSALKGDIDFDGMREKAGIDATESYNKILNLFEGTIPVLDIIWKDMFTDINYKDLTHTEKRDTYNKQPAKVLEAEVKKKYAHQNEGKYIWFDLEDYQCTLEEYVENAKKRSMTTFSILVDGEWTDKDVFEEINGANYSWIDKYDELINGLPDDTLLTIVDCHV